MTCTLTTSRDKDLLVELGMHTEDIKWEALQRLIQQMDPSAEDFDEISNGTGVKIEVHSLARLRAARTRYAIVTSDGLSNAVTAVPNTSKENRRSVK